MSKSSFFTFPDSWQQNFFVITKNSLKIVFRFHIINIPKKYKTLQKQKNLQKLFYTISTKYQSSIKK